MDTAVIDLKNPQFLENPYPFYHQLRESAPVFWFPHHGPSGGMWLVTRYEDVAELLKNEHLAKDLTRIFPPEKLGQNNNNKDLLSSDPPDHTRLRALVNLAFTPKRIKDMEPRILEIINRLWDDVRHKRQMDFMADFAIPLPIIVIAELLGVPPEDRIEFRVWTNDIIRGIDAIQRSDEIQKKGEESGQKLVEYFMDLIQKRRSQPKSDLLSALVHARDGSDRLSEEELIGMCQLLLIAGHETTVNLLGNGLLALLNHPDQFDLLKSRPVYLESAIEEMLRYDSPVQRGTVRFTLEPIEIAGKIIEAGQQVSAVLGAANRDPAQFPDPDRFDITRSPNRHLAFGRGIHFCLGAPLARTEARLAFRHILEHAPNLELMDDKPLWSGNTFLRGLISLPVRW
jgi:pimeloyl-[acyl-carrier protein] synthase